MYSGGQKTAYSLSGCEGWYSALSRPILTQTRTRTRWKAGIPHVDIDGDEYSDSCCSGYYSSYDFGSYDLHSLR